MTDRIEAKGASDAIAIAQEQQEVARVNDAPSLYGLVIYGFKNGNAPNLDVLRGNVLAGVELRIPVFDGNRSRSMKEEAPRL